MTAILDNVNMATNASRKTDPGSTPRWTQWATWLSVIALSVVLLIPRGASADPVLEIAIHGETRHFARDALLARPDVTSVEIARDIAYSTTMRFRAIPLAALLPPLSASADGVIETVAIDGFAAQLPVDLVTNTDPAKAVAWLAIESDDAPWPPLPGKTASAGPFYIVWTGAMGIAAGQTQQRDAEYKSHVLTPRTRRDARRERPRTALADAALRGPRSRPVSARLQSIQYGSVR